IAALPEDNRILIRSAVNRIRDIANSLLRSRQSNSVFQDQRQPVVCLLPSLVDTLLTEKRTQYRSRLDVEIEGKFDVKSYGLFLSIEPLSFKRVLSNLVDNAVESLPDAKGKVCIRMHGDTNVIVEISDNGKGIPANIIPML